MGIVLRNAFPRPPKVPLLRALWSLSDGILGLLKGSRGVLDVTGPDIMLQFSSFRAQVLRLTSIQDFMLFNVSAWYVRFWGLAVLWKSRWRYIQPTRAICGYVGGPSLRVQTYGYHSVDIQQDSYVHRKVPRCTSVPLV